MPYSKMDNITWRKLALISERARKDSQYQFTSLAHLLSEGFLRECYYRLGRDRASGIDGITWKEYGKELDENLKRLVDKLKKKQYKPLPARRVYIPKNEHEKRPLGLPALEDKIVQKGIASILESIYEADFMECSYGFRPGRSCHLALKAVGKLVMTKQVNHIVECDIKGFFDNVSHYLLLKFLGIRIKDPSFLLLIRRFLGAGHMENGQVYSPEAGTPQGGNLSPSLSNVFLHNVLDLWFHYTVKAHVKGYCELVRYADDFICVVQYADDAKRIKQALKRRFQKYELEIHPEKSRIISFGRNKRYNAKMQNRRPNTFDFLGFTHYCSISRKRKFKVGRKTSAKKFRTKCKDMNVWLKATRNERTKEWWPILQAKLRGHYQYYGVSGNIKSISCYYFQTICMVYKWLNRRSQRKSYNWEGFREYLKKYPLPQPRIVYNMYELSSCP